MYTNTHHTHSTKSDHHSLGKDIKLQKMLSAPHQVSLIQHVQLMIFTLRVQGHLKGGQSRLLKHPCTQCWTSLQPYQYINHNITNTNPSCLQPFWCLSGSANPTSSHFYKLHLFYTSHMHACIPSGFMAINHTSSGSWYIG